MPPRALSAGNANCDDQRLFAQGPEAGPSRLPLIPGPGWLLACWTSRPQRGQCQVRHQLRPALPGTVVLRTSPDLHFGQRIMIGAWKGDRAVRGPPPWLRHLFLVVLFLHALPFLIPSLLGHCQGPSSTLLITPSPASFWA